LLRHTNFNTVVVEIGNAQLGLYRSTFVGRSLGIFCSSTSAPDTLSSSFVLVRGGPYQKQKQKVKTHTYFDSRGAFWQLLRFAFVIVRAATAVSSYFTYCAIQNSATISVKSFALGRYPSIYVIIMSTINNRHHFKLNIIFYVPRLNRLLTHTVSIAYYFYSDDRVTDLYSIIFLSISCGL